MAAATAAAAAAGEGMEPRALQYEQTLVSETQGLRYRTNAAGCPRKCKDRRPTLTRPHPFSAVETEVRNPPGRRFGVLESCLLVSGRDWWPAEDNDTRCLAQVSFLLPTLHTRFCFLHLPLEPKLEQPSALSEHHLYH